MSNVIHLAQSDALFSDCRRYRYSLFRMWGDIAYPCCMFIGLNPSTADEVNDDPTVRRCIRFAQNWGCNSMYMMNAYAFRATDPTVMKRHGYPVGPETDEHLTRIASLCSTHVACWGVHIEPHRQFELKRLLPQLKCFGLTAGGCPKHPLYLAKDTELVDFK